MPLTLVGEDSAKKMLQVIIEIPIPKPVIILPTNKYLMEEAPHSMDGPMIKSMSEKIIVGFLPILSAIIPPNNAPIAAPNIARLTKNYKKIRYRFKII